MNIGEISKPTANAQELKKTTRVNATSAIAATENVGDHIDISVKAKERYLKYKNGKKKPVKSQNESKEEKSKSLKHIDLLA